MRAAICSADAATGWPGCLRRRLFSRGGQRQRFPAEAEEEEPPQMRGSAHGSRSSSSRRDDEVGPGKARRGFGDVTRRQVLSQCTGEPKKKEACRRPPLASLYGGAPRNAALPVQSACDTQASRETATRRRRRRQRRRRRRQREGLAFLAVDANFSAGHNSRHRAVPSSRGGRGGNKS